MTHTSRLFLLAAIAVCSAAPVLAQAAPPSLGSCSGQAVTFTKIRLPQPVLANGVRLPADVYDVRITTERPAPAVGQSAVGECWVEFLKAGSVAGREVASVIEPADIASIAKGPTPKPNTARVDELKGGEHLRVWLNSNGTHYLVNLSVAPPPR
jgi:hypothetical protein